MFASEKSRNSLIQILKKVLPQKNHVEMKKRNGFEIMFSCGLYRC